MTIPTKRIAELISSPGEMKRSRPPTPTTTAEEDCLEIQVPRHLVLTELTTRLSPRARECWQMFAPGMKTQYAAEVYRRADRVVVQDHTVAEAIDFALTDVAGILNKCAERLDQ